jgi:hypothetical protein
MEVRVREHMPSTNGQDDVGAAAEALLWAETSADRGDFSFAVKWLDRAEHLLGGLTPRYEKRRYAWERAANGDS